MTDTILSLDTIRRKAPSVFAESGYTNTSERYSHISTLSIIDAAAANGFFPVYAQQADTRIEDKNGYTRHLLRFRPQQYIGQQAVVGGLVPEVVLINDHSAASALRLMAGIYRFVCANGMIIGESCEEVRVRHAGDVSDVIDGCISVFQGAEEGVKRAQDWKQIPLVRDEQLLLAKTVADVRYGEGESPVDPYDLLQVRRWDDRSADLWTTINVIQENTIKGGVRAGRSASGRRRSTREVKSIPESVRLNRAIMTLGEEFAKLKG